MQHSICELTEGALHHLIQINDTDIKQSWPQHQTLGNTTQDQPPSVDEDPFTTTPWVQPCSQVVAQMRSAPIQAMRSQLLLENAVGDSVEGFTEDR